MKELVKFICIKDTQCGYVPVTNYKIGDIVDVCISDGIGNDDDYEVKYFDDNTGSELRIEYFKSISEHRDRILHSILNKKVCKNERFLHY